ncbi:MAG: hypothetical protein E6K60_11350 [Nitrospirae bacterium]|nr:MAG: hypothetical protein E6K60_11350 [Nitrospirota bacterium]
MKTLLTAMFLLVAVSSVPAQEDLAVPPGMFDAQIQQMKFDQPTRIVGKLIGLDGYEDAVWIEWTHRYDGKRWQRLLNDMQFKVLPRDPGMMEFFKQLKPGAVLHLTVQMDEEGNRQVLELDGT